MAAKTTFIVQTFEKKRGKLVPTAKDIAPSENGAVKRAQAMATRFPGTAAICVVADDETGELHAAKIIQSFGEVPDDFAESLIGG